MARIRTPLLESNSGGCQQSQTQTVSRYREFGHRVSVLTTLGLVTLEGVRGSVVHLHVCTACNCFDAPRQMVCLG